MSGLGVYERTSPPSPYWQIKVTYLGETLRESSKVLIGTTARERKESFARAEEKVRQWKLAKDARVAGKFEKGTLGDAMDLYFKQRLCKSRPVRQALARKEELEKIAVVRNFLSTQRRIYGGIKPMTVMEEITEDQIKRFARDLEDGGKLVPTGGKPGAKTKLRDEGCAASTVNAYLRVLSAVLNFAHEEKLLIAVPAIKWLDESAAKDEPVKALEDDEVDAVLAAARAIHPRYERALKVAFFTGARKTEMFALTWDKIDLKSNGPCRVDFTTQTKRGKLRNLVIPEGLRAMLLEMKADQQRWGYTGNRVFAFKHSNGRVFEPKSMDGPVTLIQEATGIEDFHLHVCRHTYASRLLRSGAATLDEVSILLGHEDRETTEIYAHFAPTNMDKAVSRLSEFWASSDAAASAGAASAA